MAAVNEKKKLRKKEYKTCEFNSIFCALEYYYLVYSDMKAVD